jgi:hypothetical protein
VLLHAQVLMTSSPEGACDYAQGDLRDPVAILGAAAKTLDLTRPVAVSLLMILQFIRNEEDPWRMVATIMGALAPGSYLMLSQPTRDVITSTITNAADRYNSHMGDNQATVRTRAEILRFFAGLDLIEPGLVQLHQWRSGPETEDSAFQMPALAGVAIKP